MATADRTIEAREHDSAHAAGAAGGIIRSPPPVLRNVTLSWALAVSVAVHAGLFVAPLAGRQGGFGTLASSTPPLQATLVAAPQAAVSSPVEPQLVSMVRERAESPAPRLIAKAPEQPASSLSQEGARTGVPLDVAVEGQPVISPSLIGAELLARSWNEFPVEVAFPVRMRDRIQAHYPAAALEAGREGSVVLWIVVDAQANIEEIQVAEGADEDFAHAAIEAVKAAQFEPAAENGVAMRFPIALEFHFALAASTPSANAVTAGTP